MIRTEKKKMLIITRQKNKKIKTDIEKAHKAQKESTHAHTP